MPRRYWVLIAIVAIFLILVLYVLIARPTLVLPTVTVAVPQSSPLNAYQRQANINELNLRLRSDGKAFIVGDGQELGQIQYTPRTLSNALNLAQRMSLTPDTIRNIRLFPLVFPGLASHLLTTGMTAYYVLPLEITVRFIPA